MKNLKKLIIGVKGGHFWAGLMFLLLVGGVLTLALRGMAGSPNAVELDQMDWKDNGPLELSPERGRFALTFSVVEDKKVSFSLPMARFATPDLGYKNGNYVSLFAPGVSFIVIPGYILGKMIGLSQVGTYAVVALFAFLNAVLIRLIAIKMGASKTAASISGLTFVFGTPAFVYAVSLFQHHISTFLLLLSVYILIRFKNIWSLTLVWFLAAVSLSVDYPNFFMMLPVGLFGLMRLVPVSKIENKFSIKIPLLGFLSLTAAILPLLFFLWFNKVSYGSPFQLAGTVSSVQEIDSQGKPAAPKTANINDLEKYTNPDKQTKSAIAFFRTRNMLSAFDIHWFSPDRGVIFYTPVILFGFLGWVAATRKKINYVTFLASVMLSNIILYSMWGDFWGGWSFGARYLTPAYAFLAIFIGLVLTYWKRKIWFILVFGIFFCYSIGVNTLGAITTSANPPQIEVLALEKASGKEQKYTYERNWDFLLAGNSKSFVFRSFGYKYMTAQTYYLVMLALIIVPCLGLLLFLRWSKE